MGATDLRWNIFARELQDIMQSRGNELGVIDDRTSIHREKVRRLQRSLTTPKRFPLLSPYDLDDLIKAFQLTRDEVIRLQAAILATSVEATLMGRIHQDDALRAAQQVFEIAIQSLHADDHALQAVRSRGGQDTPQPEGAKKPEESDETPAALEPSLTAIDRGTLFAHLALQSQNHIHRVAYLKQASDAFAYALQEMAMLENTPLVDIWREEAKFGLSIVTAELDDAGA